MIFADPSVPLPEGEHHPAVDEVPAADSKDTADEKLDGKWRRKLQCFLRNKRSAFVICRGGKEQCS